MNELSASEIKQIAKLSEVKYRRALGLFKVEGHKAVCDTIDGFDIEKFIATSDWLDNNEALTAKLRRRTTVYKVGNRVMSRLSSLSTPPSVMSVCKIPDRAFNVIEITSSELVVALDGIQDPGNLGTIIRTCDWFGVRNILCSRGSADVYSPKTIQATMGAISRVNVYYVDLGPVLSELRDRGNKIYVTDLRGSNIFASKLTEGGIVVMGNEGNGVSHNIEILSTEVLNIPSYPGTKTSESLNVGVATAITLSQFRSRLYR